LKEEEDIRSLILNLINSNNITLQYHQFLVIHLAAKKIKGLKGTKNDSAGPGYYDIKLNSIAKKTLGCSFSKMSELKENKYDVIPPGPGFYMPEPAEQTNKPTSSFCSKVPICISMKSKMQDMPGPGQYFAKNDKEPPNSANNLHVVRYPFQSALERKV